MSARPVYLRSQDKILADMEALLRDTTNARWSDTEIYRALNLSLDTWQGRVLIPCLYSGISSWTGGTYGYSLPDYVTPPLRPQMENRVPAYGNLSLVDGAAETWVDIPGFELEPDGTGGYDLRFLLPPYSVDARILFYASNGNVPAVLIAAQPALNADITAAATSLVLNSVVSDIGRVGFVKIGNEWIQYAGVSDDGSNTTLENLIRGVHHSVAATHTSGTDVFFGVAVDDGRLWRQLYDQIIAMLHEMFLTDASSRERSHHERQVSFYQQRADNFWKTYKPGYAPRLMLSRKGVLFD